ncbi:hypothetical protein VKT23_010173 [Stygiomarasmius scandens]|uniref:Uncharacterized protein n=1 Tax=Marasmiellus scandens TaxID=2682957 RepID=A0ABR1JCU8_9AGAR
MWGRSTDTSAWHHSAVISAAGLHITPFVQGDQSQNFKRVIKQGNKDGGWGKPAEELAPVQLLKDVDTRWSSIFQMIDRLMELYLAMKEFILSDDNIKIAPLSEKQLKVLVGIHVWLSYFHTVQEIVSADSNPINCTPTL